MDSQHVVAHVLLAVAVVVIAARVAGRLATRIGQPAVIGEIVAGIVLGPSLLGALPGGWDAALFPTEIRPHLTVVAQLGLALFMFVVGLELDLSLIRGRAKAAGAVAAGSLLLPFGLGAGAAVLLFPLHRTTATGPVPEPAFVLFLGVAMAITALPVLARILTERGMHRTGVGTLALACAVIGDVIGWTLLAVVVAVVAGGSPGGALTILAAGAAFTAVLVLLVRPLLARMVPWHRRAGRLTPDMLAVVLAGLLLSAWVTDAIGVHAIFGAFLFGAVMPRHGAGALTREILGRLEQVSLSLLLPVFFVVAGLQVDVGGIGPDGLWQLGLLLVVAVVGKVVGAGGAARLLRLPRRQQLALALLMNTRGLTELVILQVGLQLGVLDPAMYTMLVIMALVTTAMTGPLLRRVYPDRVLERELAAGEAAELRGSGGPAAHTVLVLVPEDAAAAERAVALAGALTGATQPARVVACRLLRQDVELDLAGGMGAELAVLAAVGDELRGLAGRLADAGTPCSVVARFATDPAAELVGLAERWAADVVLLCEQPTTVPAEPGRSGQPTTAELVAALAAVPEVTVVIADPAAPQVADADGPGAGADGTDGTGAGPAGRVGVLVDGGAGGRAALRIGAALARRGGGPLAVADPQRSRRASAMVSALGRRGVPATAVPATDLAGTAPDTGATPGTARGAVGGSLVLPLGMPLPTGVPTGGLLRVRAGAADADDDLDQALDRALTPPHP